ncbi:caspase a [Diretmus argenteus]
MAAAELVRVRTDFVKSVSVPVIKGLLDDLLEDKILNDDEKEYVLEENNGRADRARCLIDLVKKKGDKSSRKMIDHLEERAPELHSELKLSSGPPAQEADSSSYKEEQHQQQISPILIHSKVSFKAEILKKDKIYPVIEKSKQSRLALLITNVKFDDEKLMRHGAEKDEENMEKLLTALGYKVMKHRNLSGEEIDDAVRQFSQHPGLDRTDSVFVIIMSHGKMGAILGIHHKKNKPDVFPIERICTYLSTGNCPALLDKPKVIIIQACRGEKDGSVMVSDGPGAGPSMPADMEDDGVWRAHREKDFIYFLSCTPETVSYRQREHGSLLFQYVVEIFNTFACEHHIEELFTKVMQRFEDFPCANKRQMPTKDRCTLTKPFYLFPGL